MTRALPTGLLLLLGLVASSTPAEAQDQGFSISAGYFAPRGQDSRVDGDVLNANRCIDVTFLCEPLLFEVDDFGGFIFGGEYLIGVGKYLEAGVGISFYQRNVDSIYEFVTRPDGTEIEQDLKLRIVPITGTLKFVPTGRDARFQPYIGAGIAALMWDYSESGEFVDPVDGSIFRPAPYKADGTEVAPVIFGGIRGPISASMMLGGEVRYQKAEAELSTDDFLGDRLDLGGLTFQGTLTWRF